MPVYLRWLRDRLESLGGTVTRVSLADLPQPEDGLVVNCAGLGARRLVGETDVHPARGQVLLVAGSGVDRWWLDESGPTYVVPRGDHVVVGGTFEPGDWSRTPDPAIAERIWRRAVALVPALAGGEVVGHRVGLRPVRSARAARAGGRRRPLLRPRRGRDDAQLGLRRRGRGARRRVTSPTRWGRRGPWEDARHGT